MIKVYLFDWGDTLMVDMPVFWFTQNKSELIPDNVSVKVINTLSALHTKLCD